MVFQPGVSGNPKGRRKHELSLTDAARRELKAHPEKVEEIVRAWIDGCLTNPAMLRELLDRIEGKVPQAVTGASGGGIEITVRYAGDNHEAGHATE